MPAASGTQYRLHRAGPQGEVRATVTELAAGLRELTVGGRTLVQSFGEDVVAPMGCGMVLVPWPNRVRDARWTLDGEPQQLDVTEAATGNASHGLLRNTGYRAGDHTDHAVTLLASVFPQHGYPFRLDTSVAYTLDDDGLRVRLSQSDWFRERARPRWWERRRSRGSSRRRHRSARARQP